MSTPDRLIVVAAFDLDDDGNTTEPLPLDLAGNARFLDVAGSADTGNGTPPVVDMGAYEAAWADLRLTKTAAPTTAVPGAAITYTLVFSNAGSLPATGVVITDTIPLSVTATSVVSSGVAITQTSPGYVWAAGDLAPGEGGVITITGAIRSPLAGGTFTNNATIGTTAADGNTTNNSDAAGVLVGHRIFLPVVGRGASSPSAARSNPCCPNTTSSPTPPSSPQWQMLSPGTTPAARPRPCASSPVSRRPPSPTAPPWRRPSPSPPTAR